jgi:hypothetical protein
MCRLVWCIRFIIVTRLKTIVLTNCVNFERPKVFNKRFREAKCESLKEKQSACKIRVLTNETNTHHQTNKEVSDLFSKI